jgi:hypothetical protein
MKNFSNAFLLIVFSILYSCKSTGIVEQTATQDDHFKLVIEDYYKNNKDYIRRFKMYYLSDVSPQGKDYFLYNVFPVDNKYSYAISSDSYTRLPSGYIEYKDKIFFIEEENPKKPTPELLQYLDNLQQLDSTGIKIELGLIREEDAPIRIDRWDETIEGVDYVICINNPYKFKKKVRGSKYIKPDDDLFDICN